jgi:hypothetical protein
MSETSMDRLIARSKALTLSRAICVLMLIVIIGMGMVISYQRGSIAFYRAEIERHQDEKNMKPLSQPMFKAL